MPCTATSGGGSSRTSPSARVWISPPGAAARAPVISTATASSISTSPTGGRTRCSATAATAPSRRWRLAPASPPAAGAQAARSLMPTETAIWISTSHATWTRPGSPSCERLGRWSGATGHMSWSGRPGFPESPTCSSRTSAADGSWKRPPPTASLTRHAPTASASSPPTMTTTVSSTCSSRTTRTRISCITISGTAISKARGWPPAWR